MAIRKQTWLQRNGGRAAFAASVAAAVLYALVVVAVQGPPKGVADDVMRISSALESRIAQEGERMVPALPDPAALTTHWNDRAPERQDLPRWTFNRRPDIVVTREQPVDTRKDLFPPVSLAATVDENYKVELRWKADERTTAAVTGYDVFRWTEGLERPETPLNGAPLADPAFADEDFEGLKPLTTVFYAVRARTTEEVKTPGGPSVESLPLKVEIPDDRRILYFGQGGGVEMAVLYVKRFYRGDWPWERFTVYLGDRVGQEALVPLVEGGEKIRMDFRTDRTLVEIGEEIRTVEEAVQVQKIGADGKPEFDENGQPVTVVQQRKKQVAVGFVVLVDDDGRDVKIFQSDEDMPERDLKQPGENDPLLDRTLFELKSRVKQTQDATLRRMLLMRVRFLAKNKRLLTEAPAQVEKSLLNEKDGLLFKLRWEWILAKDAETLKPRDRTRKEKSGELTWMVKDLEAFLGPEGWDKEKDEWEKDYASFRSKAEFEGREPARWAMPPRPAEVPNTDGKQKS